ncbi:MAG: PEP-utilizing enzyme, partial [Vulcanimicrobiota bacterium]
KRGFPIMSYYAASKAALETGMINEGDMVVTTAGIPAMVKGSTNMIKVDVLGRVFLRGIGVGPQIIKTAGICISNNAEDAGKCLQNGDILVTKRLDDSFLFLSGRLGGVITEEGTEGSYADYFCTKNNIPGIINVPGARKAFYSGQIITLEPERGILYGAKKK